MKKTRQIKAELRIRRLHPRLEYLLWKQGHEGLSEKELAELDTYNRKRPNLCGMTDSHGDLNDEVEHAKRMSYGIIESE